MATLRLRASRQKALNCRSRCLRRDTIVGVRAWGGNGFVENSHPFPQQYCVTVRTVHRLAGNSKACSARVHVQGCAKQPAQIADVMVPHALNGMVIWDRYNPRSPCVAVYAVSSPRLPCAETALILSVLGLTWDDLHQVTHGTHRSRPFRSGGTLYTHTQFAYPLAQNCCGTLSFMLDSSRSCSCTVPLRSERCPLVHFVTNVPHVIYDMSYRRRRIFPYRYTRHRQLRAQRMIGDAQERLFPAAKHPPSQFLKPSRTPSRYLTVVGT